MELQSCSAWTQEQIARIFSYESWCPGLSRTVPDCKSTFFAESARYGYLRLKARAPEQYSLWSYCSGALAFNRKFLPEGLRGAALAAEFFSPPFPLPLPSFLPLSLFLCARQYRTVQAGTWTCKMQLGACIWMSVTFRILRSVFHILRYARQYISNLWDSMLILYYFAALACK